MHKNKVKRNTLKVMGVLGLAVVLWSAFGTKGSPDTSAAPDSAKKEEAAPATTPVIAKADPAATKKAAPATEKVAEKASATKQEAAPKATEKAPEPQAGSRTPLTHSEVMSLLSPSDTVRARNRYEAHHDSMPPGGVKMKINYLGGSLARVFNDSNYLHINSGVSIGVQPVHGVKAAWAAGAKMERLQSCQEYYLDNLTHSLPFLVPQAHRLLTDIGKAFRDSLAARGGGDYRIKVTSVLRTPNLVRRLRRRNRNAVDTSAHLYGTTFDISYAKFICDSPRKPRTQEDMKNLLGEVIFALRAQGRCYVKYEYRQACFHITAR